MTVTAGDYPAAWRPVTMHGGTEVRHGYTLDHLHALAKVAVNRAWSRAADYGERLEAAWYGIAEHLCATASPPRPWDLIKAGTDAVDHMIADDLRQHGTRLGDPYEGPESARNYWRFWWDQAVPAPSCESRVVERQALRQIWPLLPARHRQALTALAAYGDYRLAAASMGITAGTFGVHISRARRVFLAHWHEGGNRPGYGAPTGGAATTVAQGSGRPGNGDRRPGLWHAGGDARNGSWFMAVHPPTPTTAAGAARAPNRRCRRCSVWPA